MNLRVKAFADLVTILGLILAVISVTGVSLVSLGPSPIPSHLRVEMSQAIPRQDLSFKPSNGYWYVGMGNDTGREEMLSISKKEGGNWKKVTSATLYQSIQPPTLVRKNSALFGWNGTQWLRVIWGTSSNNNLTINPFLVTDISADGRLPFVGIPTRFNNWGWY